MPLEEIFRTLQAQVSHQGWRATAVQPFLWALGTLLTAIVIGSVRHMPTWILAWLIGFTGIILLSFIAAYFLFLFKNPDALRSERFGISKMAIEKSVTGDSLIGFKEMGLGDLQVMVPTKIENRQEHSLLTSEESSIRQEQQ